ncbi:hypothetical protein KUH32_15430 [Thalassococcus sp. CAU 1522]|uniref:Type I secretion protein n=1 Tax=Thalassococcus arenae TaxID=2851652 RepID=A0ABS6NC81_9RHOB|nr:calcium-binding protein [Thalassococcus arenae]MBV2361155.1 hypothetical protein [Thalassococcus arenae]
MIALGLLFALAVPLLLMSIGSDDDDDGGSDGDENIRGARIEGTEDREFLEGGAGDDRIDGLGGDDLLAGRGGDDTLNGGDGPDLLYGGLGDDLSRGGPGDDLIVDFAGADTLIGSDGDDLVISGGTGDVDAVIALLSTTSGPIPDDAVEEALNLVLEPNPGDPGDELRLGAGDDVAILGENDTVLTGSGVDTLIAGDWIGDQAVTITEFDPASDVLVYSYTGPEPLITLTEDDDGAVGILANGIRFATLTDVDFFDIDASAVVLLDRSAAV